MLNARLSAALPIAKSIKALEQSMNDAMRHMGSTLVEIANAKSSKGTRFDLTRGLAASEKLAEAAIGVTRSYMLVTAAHQHLAEDREGANLPASAFGDFSCWAKSEDASNGAATLRVVGE